MSTWPFWCAACIFYLQKRSHQLIFPLLSTCWMSFITTLKSYMVRSACDNRNINRSLNNDNLFITGIHNCIMNVHLTSHLVHYVKLYGPLWTHSCFWFESLNGQLLRLRHGTHHASLQVIYINIYVCNIKINLKSVLLYNAPVISHFAYCGYI